ncbi:mitochondrial ribosomal death-associated protein 3-domain-containing protein [Fomitopsis betulina]|nr:mitochondrial ribosomal death-associated protein 3-domain-containing protein [Fomitopsis betulina]
MSVLSTAKCSRRLAQSLAQIGQTRSYAVPAGARKTAPSAPSPTNSFKPKKKNKEGRKLPSGPPAYKPMPVNQLTNPIFKTDQRAELQLPVFSPEVLKESSVGKALAFPTSQNEALRAFGVPDSILRDFRVLSRPCSVIRDVTIRSFDVLDAASNKSSRDTRLIMTGHGGCGKSYLLLQTVEYASHSNWIVLYIPRGVKLVNSSSLYTYDRRTQTYLQPEYSDQLLRRFLSVNEQLIRDIKTQGAHTLEDGAVPAGTSLANLVKAGAEKPGNAPLVLAALMDELSQQTQYPVLLAVDDIQAMYGYSMYRDLHYRQVMAQHLAIPRMILEFASGRKAFPRGAVIGAEGTQNTTFRMPVELHEALGLPRMRSTGAYTNRSPEIEEFVRGIKSFPVPRRITIDEAASMFEIWMQDKALHSGEVRVESESRYAPNDELFMSKYAESDGNARAFIWNGLLATQSTL